MLATVHFDQDTKPKTSLYILSGARNIAAFVNCPSSETLTGAALQCGRSTPGFAAAKRQSWSKDVKSE